MEYDWNLNNFQTRTIPFRKKSTGVVYNKKTYNIDMELGFDVFEFRLLNGVEKCLDEKGFFPAEYREDRNSIIDSIGRQIIFTGKQYILEEPCPCLYITFILDEVDSMDDGVDIFTASLLYYSPMYDTYDFVDKIKTISWFDETLRMHGSLEEYFKLNKNEIQKYLSKNGSGNYKTTSRIKGLVDNVTKRFR